MMFDNAEMQFDGTEMKNDDTETSHDGTEMKNDGAEKKNDDTEMVTIGKGKRKTDAEMNDKNRETVFTVSGSGLRKHSEANMISVRFETTGARFENCKIAGV